MSLDENAVEHRWGDSSLAENKKELKSVVTHVGVSHDSNLSGMGVLLMDWGDWSLL